jgi:hypothetical protein
VKLKLEIVWEIRFVAPNYPPEAGVDQAKFMARGVDAFDSFEFKVPAVFTWKISGPPNGSVIKS